MPDPDWLAKAKQEGRVLSEKKAKPPSLFTGEGAAEDQPKELTLVLPYPPSVNHYWVEFIQKFRDGGQRINKSVGKPGIEFRKEVVLLFSQQRGFTLRGPLCFSGVFCAPDRRVRDLDNVLKPLIDALKRNEETCFVGAYDDDKQIRHINVRFGDVIRGGKCVVTISQLA